MREGKGSGKRLTHCPYTVNHEKRECISLKLSGIEWKSSLIEHFVFTIFTIVFKGGGGEVKSVGWD